MFSKKCDYFVERATIVAICLWGNWAIYYWVMVLIFDASFNTLKACIPILLLQIAASLFFLLRTDLGFGGMGQRFFYPVKRPARSAFGVTHYVLLSIATLLAVAVVFAADHYHWTQTPLYYNLFWALLLPFALVYLLHARTPGNLSPTPVIEERNRAQTLDSLLFIFTTLTLAIILYGSGFHTGDDAFYGHVMSSTIANPELPVQGQDLLLNTSDLFSVHPAYRLAGYEVLIALLSDVVGKSPLYFYYDIFPVFGIVFSSFAVYLFMRAMRVPYPGLAVTVSFLILEFVDVRFQASSLRQLWMGKSLVALLSGPLIFFSVAAFLQMRTLRSWLLLLFSVCSLAIVSTTALFVAPLSAGLASVVFLPSYRRGLPALSAVLLALTPIFLLILYSVLVNYDQSVNEQGEIMSGRLMVDGTEYGSLYLKSLFLLLLVILPLMARATNDAQFQTNIVRLCMVGFFSVMAPFFIEAIVMLTGLNLLAVRLPTTVFPLMLLCGVIASIAVARLHPKYTNEIKYLVLFFVLIAVASAYGINRRFYNTMLMFAKTIGEIAIKEAQDTRLLIPENAYVAAGALDDVLPILPEPPRFIAVRFYLTYHERFLSDTEYSDRKYLYTILRQRSPMGGENLETTMNMIVSTADRLGVTTLIFTAQLVEDIPEIDAQQESEINRDPQRAKILAAFKRVLKENAEKEGFVKTLTTRLEQAGYVCATTPSGNTRVCNRKI